MTRSTPSDVSHSFSTAAAAGEYTVSSQLVPAAALPLLRQMLTVAPKERATLEAVEGHGWLQTWRSSALRPPPRRFGLTHTDADAGLVETIVERFGLDFWSRPDYYLSMWQEPVNIAVVGGMCGWTYVSPADSRKYYPSYVTAIYFIGIALVCCAVGGITAAGFTGGRTCTCDGAAAAPAGGVGASGISLRAHLTGVGRWRIGAAAAMYEGSGVGAADS